VGGKDERRLVLLSPGVSSRRACVGAVSHCAKSSTAVIAMSRVETSMVLWVADAAFLEHYKLAGRIQAASDHVA
jgi:hypothetical protein